MYSPAELVSSTRCNAGFRIAECHRGLGNDRAGAVGDPAHDASLLGLGGERAHSNRRLRLTVRERYKDFMASPNVGLR